MDWKKIACTALAVPILYASAGSFKSSIANAENSPMLPKQYGIEQMVVEENLVKSEGKNIFSESENCPTRSEKKPFYFDFFKFTPFENVKLDGRLRNFANRHPSFQSNFLGFQNLLMLPTRLFGKCDWWPDKLEWTFGVENDAYYKDESARQITWNLKSEFRWYFKPNKFVGGGWQHHSSAGMNFPETEKYILENSINLEDSAVRDIIFFRFADKFNLGKTELEGFLGRSFWESTFKEVPASFLNKEKRKHYQSIIGGFKITYPFARQLDTSFKWEGEFSTSRASPQRFGVSADLFSSPRRKGWGASLYYQVTKGVGDGKIHVGYHGLRMNEKVMGARVFYKP